MDKEAISKRLISLSGNLKQEYVAEQIGISVSALSMYEKAQRIPRDEIKVRLARFYNTSIQELFFN